MTERGDEPNARSEPAEDADPLLAGAALGTTQGAVGAIAGNDELVGRGDPSATASDSATERPIGQDPAIDPLTGELKPPAEQNPES
jgi:hypothetical protein